MNILQYNIHLILFSKYRFLISLVVILMLTRVSALSHISYCMVNDDSENIAAIVPLVAEEKPSITNIRSSVDIHEIITNAIKPLLYIEEGKKEIFDRNAELLEANSKLIQELSIKQKEVHSLRGQLEENGNAVRALDDALFDAKEELKKARLELARRK